MSKISKEDRELFRATIGVVERHRDEHKLLKKSKPAAVPYKTREDADQVMEQLQQDPFSGVELETGD